MAFGALGKLILAFAVLGGCFAMFAMIITGNIVESEPMAAVIGGALIPTFTLIIQFYFRKKGPDDGPTNGNSLEE